MNIMRLQNKIGLMFLTVVLTAGVFGLFASEVLAQCQDECSVSAQRRCAADDLGYQVCGNYDSDKCLEWSAIYYCGWGKVCGDEAKCASNCEDECLYSSQRRCADSGKGYQVCGNYDSDKCLEWSYTNYCKDNKVCISGECAYNCANECAFSGQKYCLDNGTAKVCGYYDSDPCLDWQTITCQGSTECGYGKCSDTQRPYWQCYNGQCDYDCQYRSSCEPIYSQNSQDHLGCYDNDVYWFDERGRRQEKKQECGDYYCSGWSDYYCIGNEVYRKKTCYQPTCVGSNCEFNEQPLLQLREKCSGSEVCKAGDCIVETCECSQGPCCDGCHFKDENVVCETQSQTDYGCPWGTACGSAVGKRVSTKFQYCSGDSAQCKGNWSSWSNWTNWLVADNCSMQEVCSLGKSTCQVSAVCSQTGASAPASNGGNKGEPSNSIACVCPECLTETSEQDKDKGKAGVAAFLSLSGFKTLLLSWAFWMLISFVSIGILLAKRFEIGDWLAKKKLKREVVEQQA